MRINSIEGVVYMTLKEKQEEMRKRQVQEKEKRSLLPSPTINVIVVEERKKCISCNRRWERRNTAYCSRCTAKGLVNKHRDVLPGMLIATPKEPELTQRQEEIIRVEAEHRGAELVYVEDPVEKFDTPPNEAEPESYSLDTQEKVYTRSQVSKMFGVSNTTLCRWELKGKTPQPIRKYNGKCFYTEEHIAKIREYMSRVPPPRPATQGGADDRYPFAAKKASPKLNKKLERIVATFGGGRGKL